MYIHTQVAGHGQLELSHTTATFGLVGQSIVFELPYPRDLPENRNSLFCQF